MLQLEIDQVKAELRKDMSILIKDEVHKEIAIFLKELEIKVLKMVGPLSEEEVAKAIKDHLPVEGTVEYMNYWAGVNLISFLKRENDKIRKELREEIGN